MSSSEKSLLTPPPASPAKYDEPSDSENDESSDPSLFSKITLGKASVESVLSEWISEYETDAHDAMIACSVSQEIDRAVIEDQDVISDALETMTKDIEVVTSYHLVRKGRGAIPQFKKKFTDFWRRWLIKMSSKGILAQDDGWCLELLKAWLVTMSTSSLRAFRHTGCFVSLVVITWICGDVKKMNGEIETVVKQIGVEEKKDGSARAITLGVKLQGVKEKKHLMEEYMSDMYNSVFVHRYRDSEPLIRKDCVAELGAWIKALPETYLDPQYLRYVGWLLSDKIASVRLESVKCLVKLYSNEGMIQGLSQFSERFKTRILEMAEAEVNPGIQLQAVNVGICMSKAGLLEDEDQDQLLSLIFNENEQVRAIVVTHFLEIFEEEVDGRLEEFEGVVNEEWIRFKVLAELITKYSVDEAVRNRIDRAVYKDSQSQNNAGSQNGSMVSQEEERIPSSLMKLHQEALIMRGVTGSTSGFCEYFHGAEGEKGIGYDRIHRVVALIFKESKVLKNWTSLWEFLNLDFTSSLNEDDDVHERDDLIKHYGVSDEEELVLVCVLSSVIKLAGTGDKHAKVSQEVIKYLPKLLGKYEKEFAEGNGMRRLIEVLEIVTGIKLSIYVDMRMVKAFESLLETIMNVFTSHTNTEVLVTCCKVFDFLTGDGEERSIIFEGSVERLTGLAEGILGECGEMGVEMMKEVDGSGELERDFCEGLRMGLVRFNYLTRVVGVSGEEEGSVFSVMDGIVKCMHAIMQTGGVDKEFYKTDWVELDDAVIVRLSAESVLENALDCMLHDNEMDIVNAGDEDVEACKVKSDVLVKICEGIVMGKQEGRAFDRDEDDMEDEDDEKSVVEFSLPLQLAALACLVDLYAARNCDECIGKGELNLVINKNLPKRVSAILTQLVDIVGFPSKVIDAEKTQLISFRTIDVVMGVYTLMGIGLMRNDIASLWYACYGGGDRGGLCGGTWDGVVEVYEKESIESVVEALEAGDLGKGGGGFKGIAKLWRLGMEQAMFLYFTGRYADVGRVNNLARMIVGEIKALSPSGKKQVGHKFSDAAKECILGGLFAMLKQGGESMISCLRIWRRRKAVEEYGDGGLEGENIENYCVDLWGDMEGGKSLADMNMGWGVWGAVGGAIFGLSERFGYTGEQVDEIREDIQTGLNGFGFKPSENDADWAEYWKFRKALEKGDSVVGRGRKSVGGRKKVKKSVAKVKKVGKAAKPSKKRKVMENVEEEGSDRENEGGSNEGGSSQPTRRSQRKSLGVTRFGYEGSASNTIESDEEEEVVKKIVPVEAEDEDESDKEEVEEEDEMESDKEEIMLKRGREEKGDVIPDSPEIVRTKRMKL